MKVALTLTFLLAAVEAFVPSSRPFGMTSTTALYDRPDTSEYVQAALAATKKYGAASKEARIAWETVEEMDSADNSNAYAGGVTDEDCLVDERSDECKDYHSKMAELAKIMEDVAPKKERVKSLVEEIQTIKLATPETARGADSPALRQAMETAKEASKVYGADSKEAKLAWEDVEEVAAARNYENAMGGTLEDECLVEQIEACEGIEELKRVLSLTNPDSNSGQ